MADGTSGSPDSKVSSPPFIESKNSFMDRIGLGNTFFNRLNRAGFREPPTPLPEGINRYEGLDDEKIRAAIASGKRPDGVTSAAWEAVKKMYE